MVENRREYQHLVAVVGAMNTPAALLDSAGAVIFANSHLALGAGRSAALVPGVAVTDYLEPEDRQQFAAFCESCAGDAAFRAEAFVCSFAFGMSVIDFQITAVADASGIIGYLCQAQPKTDAQNLRLKYLMEHLDQGVWDYDIAADRLVVSDAWRRMRGLGADKKPKKSGWDWLDEIHPDDRAALKQVFEGQTQGITPSINTQYRHRHRDGHWVWIMCKATVVAYDDAGVPSRIVGTDTDITQLRSDEENMAQLAEKLRLAVDAAGIGVWEFDPNTGNVYWDDTMLEMYGATDGINDRPGSYWETHLHPEDREGTVTYAEHCQQNGLDFRRDYRIVRPDGAVRHIRSHASQVTVPGRQPKLVGANIDITADYLRAQELEQARARFLHDSRHDALTGLANRRLLDETTAALFTRASADDGYAVLHLDLDHFKAVNDTLGHVAGDAVLTTVADRLRGVIGDSGLVCRTGGDEFAILFEDVARIDTLDDICIRIVNALGAPIRFDGHLCKIGVSIGCALGKGPVDERSDIFLKADNALYAAKSAGRNCYRMSPDKAKHS